MKGTCNLRYLRTALFSGRLLSLVVVTGRIKRNLYLCVLRGPTLYENRTKSAILSQHASGVHSIRLRAIQQYACGLSVDSHYGFVCPPEPDFLTMVLQC